MEGERIIAAGVALRHKHHNRREERERERERERGRGREGEKKKGTQGEGRKRGTLCNFSQCCDSYMCSSTDVCSQRFALELADVRGRCAVVDAVAAEGREVRAGCGEVVTVCAGKAGRTGTLGSAESVNALTAVLFKKKGRRREGQNTADGQL